MTASLHINKIKYTLFDVTSKDLYHSEICVYFGTDSVENVAANQRLSVAR